MQGVLRTSGRPAKIKLRATVKGLPAGAEVEITDVMFQPDQAVSGWIPHVTELPWSAGMTYLNTAPGGEVVYWDDIKERPVVFPPGTHKHAIGDVTGLRAELDGKVSRGDVYEVSDAAGKTVSVWDYANERWQVVYGKSGTRDITALSSVVNTGWIHLSRNGDTVTVVLYQTRLTTSGSTYFLKLPVGFRPAANSNLMVNVNQSTGAAIQKPIQLFNNGNIAISNAAAGEAYRDRFMFETDEPWPATLPGIPT